MASLDRAQRFDDSNFARVPSLRRPRRKPRRRLPPARVTLDQAIDLALQHNHSLQAARTTILQNQAQEITANLRPNPVLIGDAQFLPVFQSE